MNQEQHDKAWKLLEEKGLSLGQMMMVRSNFSDIFKEEYPFVVSTYWKGNLKHYKSGIKAIESLYFESEKEVILANALYENMKGDSFNINEFMQVLKFTFRIIKKVNNWT